MKSNNLIFVLVAAIVSTVGVFAGGKLTGGQPNTLTENQISQPFYTSIEGEANRIIFPASGSTATSEFSQHVGGNGKLIFRDFKKLTIQSLDGSGEKIFKNIEELFVQEWKSDGSARLENVKKVTITTFSGKGNISINENTPDPVITTNTTTTGAGILKKFQTGKIDETSIKVIVGYEDRTISPGGGNSGKVLTVTDRVTGKKKVTFQDWTALSITSLEGEGEKVFINVGNLQVTNWNSTGNCQLQGVKATKIVNFIGNGNIKVDGNSQVPVVDNQSGKGTISQ